MKLLLCSLTLLVFVVPALGQKKGWVIPDGVTVVKDIDYSGSGDPRQTLDIYRPEGSGANLPVVMWVHGGGWKQGSKEKPKAVWLAGKGFALVSINYRLIPEHQWPSQIEDCQAAVRWIRENAEEYGLDPEKVGVFGGSAGGHLVALMGTRPADPEVKVQAVCDWYGPSELLTMPPNVVSEERTLEMVSKSNGAMLLGSTVRDVPEKARDASAIEHVSEDDSPFLIMHGSEDPGVPLVQSVRLHEKLKAAGVDSTLVVVEGAGHGGKEFQTAEVRMAVETFFDRVLK